MSLHFEVYLFCISHKTSKFFFIIAVAQTVSCRILTVEDWIQSHVGLVVNNVALGQDFSPSTSAFPSSYLSVNSSYCSSSHCYYKKDMRSKTGDLKRKKIFRLSKRRTRKAETSSWYSRTILICIFTRLNFFSNPTTKLRATQDRRI
jgi:hypothetical protein